MSLLRDLVKGRDHADLRALTDRFIRDTKAWMKARRFGGRAAVEGLLSSLVARIPEPAAEKLQANVARMAPPHIAPMLRMMTPASAVGPVASLVLGPMGGTDEEELSLRRLYQEIEQRVESLPQYGHDSLETLTQDSQLLERLAEATALNDELMKGVQPNQLLSGFISR